MSNKSEAMSLSTNLIKTETRVTSSISSLFMTASSSCSALLACSGWNPAQTCLSTPSRMLARRKNDVHKEIFRHAPSLKGNGQRLFLLLPRSLFGASIAHRPRQGEGEGQKEEVSVLSMVQCTLHNEQNWEKICCWLMVGLMAFVSLFLLITVTCELQTHKKASVLLRELLLLNKLGAPRSLDCCNTASNNRQFWFVFSQIWLRAKNETGPLQQQLREDTLSSGMLVSK